MGPFLDDTDGVTPETGLTVSVKLAKAGGTKVARSSATAITHDSDGDYAVELNATDTDTLGRLRAYGYATGAMIVWEDFTILHANVYDVLFGSVAPSTHTAAAVWDEARTGHTTAGTFGFFLDAAISGVSTGGVSAEDIATAVLDAAAETPIEANIVSVSGQDVDYEPGGQVKLAIWQV